jgi:hypothetical protein
LIASPGTEGPALYQWCDYDLCRDVSLALIEKIAGRWRSLGLG